MNSLFHHLTITNEHHAKNKEQAQLSPIPELKLGQKKSLTKLHRMNADLHTIVEQHNKDIKENTLNKSKVDRKDTKQTDPEATDYILKNQQPMKNQVIPELIMKSQQDPFLRRKLQTMIKNDLKSLKMLNDNKNKTSSYPGGPLKQNVDKKTVAANSNITIDGQYTRIPKDISKVLDYSISKLGNALRRISSESHLLSSHTSAHSKPQQQKTKNQQDIGILPYTTLRKQSYKKKVENIELLRQIHDQKK